MAPQLKLSDNIRVRCFGSSLNTNGIGKYLVPNPSVVYGDLPGDVMHISKMCLSNSLSRQVSLNPLEEDIIVSPMLTDVAPDAPSDGECCATRKKKKQGLATNARKKRKPDAPTITRCIHEPRASSILPVL